MALTCSATTSAHDGQRDARYVIPGTSFREVLCHGCADRWTEMGLGIIPDRRSDPARPDRRPGWLDLIARLTHTPADGPSKGTSSAGRSLPAVRAAAPVEVSGPPSDSPSAAAPTPGGVSG